jgi:hypothetical protein
MKITVLKLGTECTDKATGLKGTLTHWVFGLEQVVHYLLQPRGLDEKGQPVDRIFLCRERILDAKDVDLEEVEIPYEILGTIVTDKASGFTGMATEFIRHINGCFHVAIQPKGVLPKDNSPIKSRDFDLRGCAGDKITELSETERKKSIEKTPSPTGTGSDRNTHSESLSLTRGDRSSETR